MFLKPEDIYECAFLAEKWPEALAQLAATGGARGGGLLTTNQDVQNWIGSPGIEEELQAFVRLNVLRAMGQKPRVYEAGQHSFITELDVFTPEELEAHPLYRDFLRPRGLGWSARSSVRLPTGDNIVMTVERALADGPVPAENLDALNLLRPHLARAALMSARLQHERARAAAHALAALGLPALLFDSNAKVIAANSLIEAMPEQVSFAAFDKVVLKDPRAASLFLQAVACAEKGDHAAPYTFPICEHDGLAAQVAHVIPICGDSRDVFVRSVGILVLTPVTSQQMPNPDLVQSLFDLTPAEARIARHLAKGDSLDTISESNSVTVSTVRTQLKSVLEKTGCHRQIEVAALMNGLSVVRGKESMSVPKVH